MIYQLLHPTRNAQFPQTRSNEVRLSREINDGARCWCAADLAELVYTSAVADDQAPLHRCGH